MLFIEIFLSITGFIVNPSTGIITTTKEFDYETENTPINITCTVNDTKYYDSVMITVMIKDMNDNAPIFNSSLYRAYIKENTHGKMIFQNVR